MDYDSDKPVPLSLATGTQYTCSGAEVEKLSWIGPVQYTSFKDDITSSSFSFGL